MKDVTEVKGMGSFSILVDPTGAMIALWEAKARQSGT
jgi:predicted enzyme related to lactoylglutathione lyase